MNHYDVQIKTEDITDSIEVEAATPEAAEEAGYEWFDVNYYDHHECVEFSVDVMLVDENADPAACYRCGGGPHGVTPHVYMSNAEYGMPK